MRGKRHSHPPMPQHYILNENAARAAARTGYAPRSARKQGSRLLADRRIMARITQLRANIAKLHCADAEQLMAKLESVFCQAVETHQWGAAVRAVELQAQLAGVMPRARRRGGQAQMGTNGENKNIIAL